MATAEERGNDTVRDWQNTWNQAYSKNWKQLMKSNIPDKFKGIYNG